MRDACAKLETAMLTPDRGCGDAKQIQGIKVCKILVLLLLASYELGELGAE